jgi:hypothetical protein
MIQLHYVKFENIKILIYIKLSNLTFMHECVYDNLTCQAISSQVSSGIYTKEVKETYQQ